MTDAMYKEIRERRRILGLDPDDFLVDIPTCHRIVQIEERYGITVYATVYSNFGQVGEHLTLLYLTESQKDWEEEKKWLREMQPMAYVVNLTYPELSEFGTVVLRSNDGVLERIG